MDSNYSMEEQPVDRQRNKVRGDKNGNVVDIKFSKTGGVVICDIIAWLAGRSVSYQQYVFCSLEG